MALNSLSTSSTRQTPTLGHRLRDGSHPYSLSPLDQGMGDTDSPAPTQGIVMALTWVGPLPRGGCRRAAGVGVPDRLDRLVLRGQALDFRRRGLESQ